MEDVFSFSHERGTKKKILSLHEESNLRFRTLMLYHWATETLRWARPIMKFICQYWGFVWEKLFPRSWIPPFLKAFSGKNSGTFFLITDWRRMVRNIFIFFNLEKCLEKKSRISRAVITARFSMNWTIHWENRIKERLHLNIFICVIVELIYYSVQWKPCNNFYKIMSQPDTCPLESKKKKKKYACANLHEQQ